MAGRAPADPGRFSSAGVLGGGPPSIITNLMHVFKWGDSGRDNSYILSGNELRSTDARELFSSY